MALAALYLVCILAPVAALAGADNSRIAHCLFDEGSGPASHVHGPASHPHDHDGTAGQVHGGGTAQEHADGSGVPAKDGSERTCCGLLGFSALPAPTDGTQLPPARAEAARSFSPDQATSRPPERLYRPPIGQKGSLT